MMTREGLTLPTEPVTHDDLRALGIHPADGTTIPVPLDPIDAFGLMLIADADSVSDAVRFSLCYAGEHMPVGWRPKLPPASGSHVNGQAAADGGDKNGVTVNSRSASKWATVARVAAYFAANPVDVKTGAAALGLSQRHVYRILTDVIGVKP